MISYCIACYRVPYAQLLIEELEKKTTCPYEILLWINTVSPEFVQYILHKQMAGVPVRVIGISSENIGMKAFPHLFQAARYDIITQIDDDVIRISPGIAESAAAIFSRHPEVRQIVADVWQDAHTTGSRPPMDEFTLYDEADGLYDGPIDGWFSMYRRSMLPILMKIPYRQYIFVGSCARHFLMEEGQKGLLCTKFKVLHLAGPQYACFFGQLDTEIGKYRSIGRDDLAAIYERVRTKLPPWETLEQSLQHAFGIIDTYPH